MRRSAFRVVARLAATIAVIALAGCQTSGPMGEGAGNSASAASHVAKIRAENRLSALSPAASLERAALQQARYMAAVGRMVHTTGWRRDFAARMDANDVASPAAENIAEGRMDLDRLFAMWMASPPHRRNMLDARMTKFGLASAQGRGDGQRYWALVLGK